MNADIKPEVIKKTQELLGRHIKKPPLTEKLLKKPPFRFLHDIITSVIRGTGFLDGVLTSEEMNHENIKDKEGKIAFLQKVIDAVSSITGSSLSVRPTKIVAGHEPTKTNELLQAIGKALDEKRKGSEPQPSIAKRNTAKTNKEATNQVSSKSKMVTTPKATKSQPAQPQERTKAKEVDKKKTAVKTALNTSKAQDSSQITAHAASSLPKEVEQQVLVPDLMGELVDKEPGIVDELLDNGRTHLAEEETTAQDLEVKRPPSAHLRQRQASAMKALAGDNNFKKTEEPTLHATEGSDEPTEIVPVRRPMSVRPPTARPASARPAAPRIRDRGEVPRVDEPNIVTGKVNVITDNDASQDQDDDHFLIIESKQATAVEEVSPNIPPMTEGHHGHLVAQILETQKDLEDKAKQLEGSQSVQTKKIDIKWEGGRRRDRIAVKQEVEQLQNVIQKATSVVNPLGKLMDYVQEDVDAMQRELETWRDTNKQLSMQLREEQRLTDQAILPMKLQLDQLEENIREKRDQIGALKATVLHNDTRIKQLLLGDSAPAH